MSATSSTRMPSGIRPGSAGTSAWVKPSLGLRQPALDARDPADLAREADLPDRHQVLGQRCVARGTGQGECHRQVGGGLGELHPAHRRGVDVPFSQGADPAALLQHRQHHRHPGRLQPRGGSPRGGDLAVDGERLYLGDQGAAAFQRHRQTGAGHRFGAAGEEQAAGVGQARDALVVQLEAADLVRRPVAVLHPSYEPQPRVAVALEAQDDVHEVLQQTRARDGAVLGDVADQERGHAAVLGGADQGAGHLPDLGDAAGGAVDLRGGDRLHGVQDQQGGFHLVQMAQHRGQVGLRRQVQVVADRPDAVGAQAYLARRLLARDIQRAVVVARRLGGHVQQQRGLPDAGLAREEHDRARYQTAAEHAVQLRNAGLARGGLPAVDLADGQRGHRYPSGGGGPHRGRAGLLDRAPGVALRAAAEPLGRLPAALGAAIGGAVLRGRLTGSHDGHRNRRHRHRGVGPFSARCR